MRWIRLDTPILNDRQRASLSDGAWRLLVELELLCGSEDGGLPVREGEEPIDVLSWHLRREVNGELKELREGGFVTTEGGLLYPAGFFDRQGGYLKKLEYNRERQRGKRAAAIDLDGGSDG